ncbi:sigma 54-interacting transcriptional regulator [Shewanella aestuarii]|uniref:Sigma 54-interacting transcriptional regulator n=1 Tax=Shewanella aestuarii TaxID=1028752 RepID=A0A6G9QP70_9GAMM|nr:sigma 54-interacting transcriptional regulator [Shewanella aestuarii]QIR15611.1 sigma 54-interacting transcriptional regulator [Shewanella aestuarii]
MLSHLFKQAPVAMIFIDPVNNQILQANLQAQALFSLDAEKLGSYTVSQFFPDCLDKLMLFTQQVFEHGSAWSNDLSISINQQSITLDINAITLDEGVLLSCQLASVCFQHYYQSLAESNYQSGLLHWSKSETIYQEIERQNQMLLTAVGDGIYGVDKKGNATFVNEAAIKIIGWKKSELIGKNIHHMIHHSHADGSHYAVNHCPIFAAFNDGEVHSMDEEVFWSKSGKAIPVEYTSTPLKDNGELIGAVVVFRDISKRKETEQKLLNALQQVDSLKQRLEMENAYLQEEINADFNHQQIIGQSESVKHMVHQIELVAPTDANVLITGESGTGKELIARAIHDASHRKNRSFIRVNCAAIPAELFESEFFGHVKGAFSGAISDRVGRFELANDATLFLDEVGEIPLQLQGKLLRVLQEFQFERVGESKTRTVDVRVICATNQNLKALVEQNKFREDLYFRLNVFPIHSPALRDRIEDLPLLVNHFINKICLRSNLAAAKVSMAQMQYLSRYSWPGNIRELENIIERQIILAKGNKLSFECLNQDLPMAEIQLNNAHPELISAQQQKDIERTNLINALVRTKGKVYGQSGAAELLNLKPTTLSSKLKKYGINRQIYTN